MTRVKRPRWGPLGGDCRQEDGGPGGLRGRLDRGERDVQDCTSFSIGYWYHSSDSPCICMSLRISFRDRTPSVPAKRITGYVRLYASFSVFRRFDVKLSPPIWAGKKVSDLGRDTIDSTLAPMKFKCLRMDRRYVRLETCCFFGLCFVFLLFFRHQVCICSN